MRAERIILLLVVLVIVFSILLLTGVGYAVETDKALKITENPLVVSEQPDFRISFIGEPTYFGDGEAILELTGPTTSTMNITGLKKVGDSVTAIFTIENKSNNIYADIETKVTNTNVEYFNVTCELSQYIISPQNGQATLKVTVELVKTPIYNNEMAHICTNILASPR